MASTSTCLQTFHANSSARFSSRRGPLGNNFQIAFRKLVPVRILHQHASRDVFRTQFLLSAELDSRRILLRTNAAFGALIERRAAIIQNNFHLVAAAASTVRSHSDKPPKPIPDRFQRPPYASATFFAVASARIVCLIMGRPARQTRAPDPTPLADIDNVL